MCGIILYYELKFVKIGRNIVLLSFKCKIEYDYGLYVYIIDKKNFLFGVLYIIWVIYLYCSVKVYFRFKSWFVSF